MVILASEKGWSCGKAGCRANLLVRFGGGWGETDSQQWEYRAPLPPYITYIATREGWLYLAVVLDLYSRRIVGWAMNRPHDAGLDPGGAGDGDPRQRRPVSHCSSLGSREPVHKWRLPTTLLRDKSIEVSMNGVGTWYDNAPMESFFGSLKSRTRASRHLPHAPPSPAGSVQIHRVVL